MKKLISPAALSGTVAVLVLASTLCAQAAQLPEPSDALIYQLKESLVKVSIATKSGGHGFGTGVAITKDHVVTNCHVIQNANGISVSRWGEEFGPVAVQADWKHGAYRCIQYRYAPFLRNGQHHLGRYIQHMKNRLLLVYLVNRLQVVRL